jgi:uncharacterized membrane protein SirB2
MLIKYYQLFLTVHVGTVVVSICLFLMRGIWMMQGSNLLKQRWVRIVPHVNDSLLLLSAVGLMVIIGQYPLRNDWLTAKILLLLLYILFGFFAINHGQSRQWRIISGAIALAIFAYIVMVAITHNPFPLTADKLFGS